MAGLRSPRGYQRWEEIVVLEGTLIAEGRRVGTTLAGLNLNEPGRVGQPRRAERSNRAQRPGMTSRTRRAVSLGVRPTRTPTFSSASFFACAVPDDPDTIAPAWPIVFPSGAVNPAT